VSDLSAASASAAAPTISLRTAEGFGVLAGSSVSSTGLTVGDAATLRVSVTAVDVDMRRMAMAG
jgi:hypothetical protein